MTPEQPPARIQTMKKGFPSGSVCKPCWELRYCPFGSLVELFPLLGASDDDPAGVEQRFQSAFAEAIAQMPRSADELFENADRLEYLSPAKWLFYSQFDRAEVECRVWGHVCPVFWTQSGATETAEGRPESRTLSRSLMLQVVRRDNQHCRVCHKYVPDNEIEFDHIIPFSKGGPTTAENIRLLCRACNRKKSNSLNELLGETDGV